MGFTFPKQGEDRALMKVNPQMPKNESVIRQCAQKKKRFNLMLVDCCICTMQIYLFFCSLTTFKRYQPHHYLFVCLCSQNIPLVSYLVQKAKLQFFCFCTKACCPFSPQRRRGVTLSAKKNKQTTNCLRCGHLNTEISIFTAY